MQTWSSIKFFSGKFCNGVRQKSLAAKPHGVDLRLDRNSLKQGQMPDATQMQDVCSHPRSLANPAAFTYKICNIQHYVIILRHTANCLLLAVLCSLLTRLKINGLEESCLHAFGLPMAFNSTRNTSIGSQKSWTMIRRMT